MLPSVKLLIFYANPLVSIEAKSKKKQSNKQRKALAKASNLVSLKA
jgi:hypothetical protein